MPEAIVIAPFGGTWAVRHRNGFLGFASSRCEALMIALDLCEWLEGQGRPASLVIDELNSRPLAQPLRLHDGAGERNGPPTKQASPDRRR